MKSTAPINQQRGSALIPILLLTALLGVAGYLLPDLYIMAQKRTVDTSRSFKLQNVAFNLKEMGKYLLLYEKVIFLDNPFSLDPDRISAQRGLWPQAFGQWGQGNHHMINTCGGFDALANFVGDMKLNNSTVLCPNYIKSPMLSGRMLEDMVFEKWNRAGPTKMVKMDGGSPITVPGTMAKVLSGGGGRYIAEIDMTQALYNAGNQAFDVVMDTNLRKELELALNAEAKIVFEFYTDSFGFEMPGNERFVKIKGIVNYKESVGRREQVAQDSFVLFSPTIKDFSIFIPYPTKADGVTKTTNMSEALKLGGPQTEIFGRVFFRGDIDIDFDQLPIFHETVIITGKFRPTEPGPKDAQKIRTKFRKGIITNFEAAKYIMDGECGILNGAKVKINNQTDISCDKEISEYVENLLNPCADSEIVVEANGQYRFDWTGRPRALADPMRKLDCKPSRFIAGGADKVKVTGPYVFIASPVTRFIGANPSNVYGVVMGGHVDVPSGTKFYALPYLRRGLPGISTDAHLDEVGAESTAISSGVSVPLLGIPLLQDSLGSFN